MASLQRHSDNNDWYILGAGAIGCLWAAMLAKLQLNVTLLHRRTGTVGIEPVTLKYASGNSSESYPVYSTTAPDLREQQCQINQLLVATKSYDVVAAINDILPLLGSQAKVITLCNGYGMHSEIVECLNKQKPEIELYAAASSEGALLQAPLHIRHTGRGVTRIGPLQGVSSKNPLPPQLALNVEYVNNIEFNLLQKFFINCVINPLTAIYDCNNGFLLSDQNAYADFCQLCSELQTVYDAVVLHLGDFGMVPHGIDFDLHENALDVAKSTADNLSSMLQDYRAGRQLELRYLNREASAMARRMGIACPLNALILNKLG
ncbi:MAG: 2-dehydropantoate 2-reductase [Gammaproteobacteria bacterium]|nr:2-dehydropantoate 2-reductase [Gammaproteobacteria bacterium]